MIIDGLVGCRVIYHSDGTLGMVVEESYSLDEFIIRFDDGQFIKELHHT